MTKWNVYITAPLCLMIMLHLPLDFHLKPCVALYILAAVKISVLAIPHKLFTTLLMIRLVFPHWILPIHLLFHARIVYKQLQYMYNSMNRNFSWLHLSKQILLLETFKTIDTRGAPKLGFKVPSQTWAPAVHTDHNVQKHIIYTKGRIRILLNSSLLICLTVARLGQLTSRWLIWFFVLQI